MSVLEKNLLYNLAKEISIGWKLDTDILRFQFFINLKLLTMYHCSLKLASLETSEYLDVFDVIPDLGHVILRVSRLCADI